MRRSGGKGRSGGGARGGRSSARGGGGGNTGAARGAGRSGGRSGGRGGGRDGGRGEGRGGGRGGGGSGFGSNNVGGNFGNGGAPRKKTREEKKEARRATQARAVAKKAAAEDAYYRDCQRAAQANGEAAAARRGRSGAAAAQHEAALFATQGTQGINFEKYDSISVECSGPGVESLAALGDFSELGNLPSFLRRNFELMRYQKPTPIQKHAVPAALAGCDLMCCAQTGSGKTAAFLMPVCVALGQPDCASSSTVGACHGAAAPRCVVMAPTRELASQIELEAQKLCNRSPLRPVVVYGGADQRQQIRQLAIGADIIVATPGRLTDFVERNIVTLSHVQFLILDEADRMLDMGFEPQIRRIVQRCDMPPKEQRQTMMFSATFPTEIQQLAREFLRPYIWIAVGRVGSTVEGITQTLIRATADKRHKLRLVAEALHGGPPGRTLVFVQKKRTATWLKHRLRAGGCGDDKPEDRFKAVPAEDIHGDRSQAQREAALAAFRAGKCRVLVATDVAARGLDISGVEHVINMDLPLAADDFDSYVHRIGRTGRAGHTGLATSLFVPGDNPKSCNGRIAKQLIQLLDEAGQNIPPWFAALPECRAYRGSSGGSGGGGGGVNNKGRSRNRGGGEGGRMGGSDVRGGPRVHTKVRGRQAGQAQHKQAVPPIPPQQQKKKLSNRRQAQPQHQGQQHPSQPVPMTVQDLEARMLQQQRHQNISSAGSLSAQWDGLHG